MRRRDLSAQIRLNDVAFERNNQMFERVTNALDKNEERLAQLELLVEENKTFIREMTRRNEKVVQELVQRNERFNAEQGQHADLLAVGLRQLEEESGEVRQGLFALMDRLPPPPDWS